MLRTKSSKKKKLPWKGFEITRVSLNPEQAVLSCCNAAGKIMIAFYGAECCFTRCGEGYSLPAGSGENTAS